MSVDAQTDGSQGRPAPRVTFESEKEWCRVKRAAEVAGFDDPAEFVREGALRMVGETIEGDGEFECPHDDCERTFATIRQRRGHLGNAHANVFPDGDFWCGYCGYGPTAWRGVNAHHGSSSHDGPAVRLEEEPTRDDLLAPDDVPDHQNGDLLRRLYREHGGNYTQMCRAHDFEVGASRVRHYLIEFGIHEVTRQGPHQSQDGPLYRNPEWLRDRYEAAGKNIAEMHRRLEANDDEPDVPYRTLVNNLKNLGIHDPEDPPGKRHGKGGSKPVAVDENDQGAEEDADEADADQESADEPDPPTDGPGAAEEDEVQESAPTPTVSDPLAALGVDDPDAVESFDDLETPIWLDEGTFYAAADLSSDVDELANTLGWEERERLAVIVDLLGIEGVADD